MAHRKGVESKMRVPEKKDVLFCRFRAPPVTTARVPIAAMLIPRICLVANRSLNIRAEMMLMRIGESRQTKMEAREALAIRMPVY